MKGAVVAAIGLGVLFPAPPALAQASSTALDAASPWKEGAALGVVGVTYLTAWSVVSTVWWTNQRSDFTFRDEGTFGVDTYAGGADKLGHVYANYLSTLLYTSVLEWGGFSRNEALAGATLLTAVFFTGVELKDGYAPRYGFSVGDLVANLVGEGAAVGLGLVPTLGKAVSLKLMYFPSRDFRRAVSAGGPVNMPEDYSGQTYLIALHLAALPFATGDLSALRYLDFSLGYGTRGYEPLPKQPAHVRQLASCGISLDLRGLFDGLLDAPGRPRSTGAAIVHFVNEVYQPPYSRLPLFTYERIGPPRETEAR